MLIHISYKDICILVVSKMDSNEINKFAKLFDIKDFIGVFAIDELPLIPKNRTGLVIFNTDTSQRVGQHWIALCITKRSILYFDSLSSKFRHSTHFTDYMKHSKKRLVWNEIQIQSNISNKCGIHCLVFCFAMQECKNKSGYEYFLKPFKDLNVEEREKLSSHYFSLIAHVCCS